MKKLLILVLSIITCICACMFVACGDPDADKDPQILAIYNTYVAYAEENGQTPLSYEDWLESIKGEKGEQGDPGINGTNGVDGITPLLRINDETNYWEVSYDNGETWTSLDIKATGNNGQDGSQGLKGETIKSVTFDDQGRLVITLTDDTVLDPIEIPDPHTYGSWQPFGDNDCTCEEKIFYRVCSTCNKMEFKHGSALDHDWAVERINPTCQDQGYDHKVCNICGKEEDVNFTATVDHIWQGEYLFDNSFHWIKCSDCEITKNRAEHTTDDSGYCTICSAPIGATEGIIYYISTDGTYVEVVGYEGTATNIIIADEYQGKPVKNIYNEAFKNYSITSVLIPDSVESIGERAFYSCNLLTSVVIGDSVESIGSYAFQDCDSLEIVTIPDSVESIGNNAFAYCYSLESVTIPDSVESIGNYAFACCDLLESVTIGDSVKSIGDEAFYSCNLLTSVVIGDSVESIGDNAFAYCSSLTSVTIPDSVESIGSSAFAGCYKLSSVIFSDTSTWYYTDAYYNFTNKTGGTQVDVTNPSTASDKLNDYGYYWYKK